MKKKAINIITSIIGYLILLSIIPIGFIVNENLGVIIPSFAFVGIVCIYFKNDDAQALAMNWLEKFKK